MVAVEMAVQVQHQVLTELQHKDLVEEVGELGVPQQEPQLAVVEQEGYSHRSVLLEQITLAAVEAELVSVGVQTAVVA